MEDTRSAVRLYWIPLGAGGPSFDSMKEHSRRSPRLSSTAPDRIFTTRPWR